MYKLFESELTRELDKSKQSDVRKDQARKDGDEVKVDKDIEAAEIEKQDIEPNQPKKTVPGEMEMMAKEIELGGEPEGEAPPAPEAPEPKEKKEKKEKKKVEETFYNALGKFSI